MINPPAIYFIAISCCAIFVTLAFPLFLLFSDRVSKRSIFKFSSIFGICALVEFFDLISLLEIGGDGHLWKNVVLFAEAGLAPVWILFSIFYGREISFRSMHPLLKLLSAGSFLFPVAALFLSTHVFFYAPDYPQELILFLEPTAFLFYIILMVFLIIALFNLETTLANATLGVRWRMKLELLGAGLLLAALIFYYSQGLLYRTLNMNLVPVRSVALITAILLVGYSKFARGDGSRIIISRQIAYKSVVLLTVALYFVLLGILGEGLRYFGDFFDRAVFIALAFLIGAGLVLVFLSERVKRTILSFLHRNFYEQKYDYRLQWLEFTTRVSLSRTLPELYTSILTAYSDTFGLGNAFLFLQDYSRRKYYSAEQVGTQAKVPFFRPSDQIVRHLAENISVLMVRKHTFLLDKDQERFLQNEKILFLVPLRLNESVDGFLALGRPINPNEKFTEEDFDLMMVMVRQAASALLNFRLAEQLSQARDMEALGKVSAFVAHDLKNLVYSLSLLLENARDHLDNPEFQTDMLETVSSTVSKMKILIAQLKSLPEKKTLQTSKVELMRLARETSAMLPSDSEITVAGEALEVTADKEELQKVLLNLLLNGIEALEENGEIRVQISRENGHCGISVQDNGCGIDEEFLRNDLFTPFKTTKKKGLGIGLYQCKQIVEAHNGRIEVESKVGEGTTFTVWLPAADSLIR